MTDEQRREKQPLSMTRRYRRGLILTGVLCVLAMLAAATVLFQRSYTDRVDDYLASWAAVTPPPTRPSPPTTQNAGQPAAETGR